MHNNYDKNKTKCKSTRESNNGLAELADMCAHYIWANMIKCVVHPLVIVETAN